MAQLQLRDQFLICPYDSAHQILKSRIQFHLVKCAKNHPNAEVKYCPFNATHRVKCAEYQFHITSCPDRRVVEGHKYQVTDEVTGQAPVATYVEPTMPDNDENWDTSTVVSTYDPSKQIQKRNVLRKLQGATKSERKQFNLNERRRFDTLEGENVGGGTASCPGTDLQPLRKPHLDSEAVRRALAAGSKLGMGRGRIAQVPDWAKAETAASNAFSNVPDRLGLGRGRCN